MSEANYQPWKEGLSTAPDVQRIRERFNELKPGDQIGYDELASLLRVDRESNRFRTVTSAWRKAERKNGLVIEVHTNIGFYVATPAQVSESVGGTIQRGVRLFRRKRQDLAIQRTTDPVLATKMAHEGTLLHVLEREANKTRMNLVPPSKATEQPRIAPPEKAKG